MASLQAHPVLELTATWGCELSCRQHVVVGTYGVTAIASLYAPGLVCKDIWYMWSLGQKLRVITEILGIVLWSTVHSVHSSSGVALVSTNCTHGQR